MVHNKNPEKGSGARRVVPLASVFLHRSLDFWKRPVYMTTLNLTSPMNNDINNIDPRTSVFAVSLIKALSETKDIHADATNPFHKNKYATLSAHLSELKPIFAKHNLAIIQMPTSEGFRENGVGIKTIIMHANGYCIESSICVPVAENTKGQDIGSLMTYLRRYALACVAGVATEDDDCEVDRTSKSKSVPVTKPKTKVETVVESNPEPVTNFASTAASADIDPTMPVPFGNNKGTAIGSLSIKDLEYWATKWEPRPWEKTGKVSPKDSKLKATALALWEIANAVNSNDSNDEVPF